MTAKQSVQLKAYNSLVILTDNNEATAKTVLPYFNNVQVLKGLLAQAKLADAQSKQDTKGITETKQQIKAELREEMNTFADIISGFAADTNNLALGRYVDNFRSTFSQTREQEISILCEDVLTQARVYLPELTTYTVTEATCQYLQHLIDAYDGKVPQTRNKQTEKTLGTQNRADVFDKITSLVEDKLLKIAAAFKKDNLDFYNQITATTTVAKTATSPTQVKVKFQPISGKHSPYGMIAQAEGSDTPQSSNHRGEVLLKFARGGFKNIEIPLIGQETIKFPNVRVRRGKTTVITVPI